MVLIKFRVLNGDDCIDEIGRQLLVRHSFPVLHIDLAEDLAVAIQYHAGRFHLLELVQIECFGLRFEVSDEGRNVNSHENGHDGNQRDRNVEQRS